MSLVTWNHYDYDYWIFHSLYSEPTLNKVGPSNLVQAPGNILMHDCWETWNKQENKNESFIVQREMTVEPDNKEGAV